MIVGRVGWQASIRQAAPYICRIATRALLVSPSSDPPLLPTSLPTTNHFRAEPHDCLMSLQRGSVDHAFK